MKAKYDRGQINRKQAEQMGEDIFFAGVYYRRLTRLKKEPTYYGDKITAKDKNAVLIHWKESDDKYRMIFGNLRIETITADELAELEKLTLE